MAPPPSLTPSPSKKLLITDLMPKSGPNSASSSSTATAPPPPEKRTRDQPNLSDCHCCRLRINHTNPKDRLQPLDSVWRIVLLCRRCRKSVHSGKTCSYCFKETANSGDLLTCRVCERKIHKNCVRDYGNCTPWSYLGVKLEGFRVCVDCWVPDLLKNSVRVFGKSENKGGIKEKGEGKDMLENVVQDGKCEVQKKGKRVAKTKVNVLRSANGEMNAVDMADGASGLLAVKNADCSKVGNSNCNGVVEVADDAELAIQLHRVMNSSPRNLRGDSLVNSRIRDWKGLSYKRSGLGKDHSEDRKLGTCTNGAENKRMNQSMVNDSNIGFRGVRVELRLYKRDRKRKIWQLDNEDVVISESTCSQQAELKSLNSDAARIRCSMKSGADISENSVCVNMDRMNGNRFGPELVIYKRTRFKKNECQVSSMLGVSRDSSSSDSHIIAKSDYCQPADAKVCLVKNDTKVILPSESCDTERDRYHLKYVKRITGTIPDSCVQRYASLLNVNQVVSPSVSNSEAGCSVNNDELILPNPNGTCNQNSDRYTLKYTKRVKSSKSSSNSENEVHSDTFFNKIGISATGFTMNCSAESRTVSDVSFDSFTIDLPK